MAVRLAATGHRQEAERHLARASTGPLSGVAHFRVGQALERAGDLEGAVRHYTRATEIDPKETEPRQALARASGALGVVLAQRNQDADALRLLEEAARLAPESAPAQLNLAVQYARMQRYAEARSAAERALKVDPRYERAREFLKVIAKK
jgi:tetratricopeptide (TPR) repeat protein